MSNAPPFLGPDGTTESCYFDCKCDNYFKHCRKRAAELAQLNLTPVEHNRYVAASVRDDTSITYARDLWQSLRFLTPKEFESEMAAQIKRFEEAREAEEKQMAKELTPQELSAALAESAPMWEPKLQSAVCSKPTCGVPYYTVPPNKGYYSVPVQLINTSIGNGDINCLDCILEEVIDWHCVQERRDPGIRVIFTDEEEHHFIPDVTGMEYELLLLRFSIGVSLDWILAMDVIPFKARLIARCRERDVACVSDECHGFYVELRDAINGAFLWLAKTPNLARPMLLMSSSWFWNGMDMAVTTAYYGRHYGPEILEYAPIYISNCVMKIWVLHLEVLGDGVMHILRGNSSDHDVNFLQELTRVLSNEPPVTLTGARADLRTSWNDQMTAMVGPPRQAPTASSATRRPFPVHLLPSNIALRLFEIVPGCLDRLFRPQVTTGTMDTIDGWHLLTDRYMFFVLDAVIQYVCTMDAGMPPKVAANPVIAAGRKR